MWLYPKIVAHRGGGTLAPENTLAGLRAGLAHGFHAVEFDVMLSRDGIGMVIHDPEFGRTVSGQGSVATSTAVELAALDAGSWFSPAYAGVTIPRYTDFITFCRAERIWMNVEIKPADGFEAVTGEWVAKTTRDYFLEELANGNPAQLPLLSSFSYDALAAARDAVPQLPRGYLLDRLPHDWQVQAQALGVVAIHTNQRHLTAQQAGAIKQAGYGLFCYTVNDPARAREILDWGVDGFCTDRIDLIAPDFA